MQGIAPATGVTFTVTSKETAVAKLGPMSEDSSKVEITRENQAEFGIQLEADAPSIEIARTLLDADAEVTGFDPEAWKTFQTEVPEVTIALDMYDAIDQADAIVICTEWAEFCAPDFSKVLSLLKTPTIFDGRNMYACEEMSKLGFNYYSVGRPTIKQPLLQL